MPEPVTPHDPARSPARPLHGHAQAGIAVRDLQVSYGDQVALAGIDLDIRPGELHVLLGRSGAGKSTLVNALTGMLPPSARTAGEVALSASGRRWDLMHLSSRMFRSRVLGRLIGTATQGSATAFTATSRIRTQLREAMRVVSPRSGLLPVHPHLTADDDRQRIRELCWAAGAELEWLDRYPHELSGGQLSRLGMVAAMLNHPPILLADEPTSGLDQDSAATVVAALANFAHSGHAVLLITHENELARVYGDVVSIIADGVITAQGDPKALIAPRTGNQNLRPPVVPRPDESLVARGVTRVLGGQEIVRGVDLEVPRGALVGLSGPSGVGKSTLASMMALLVKPDDGVVELDGQPLHSAGVGLPQATRRRVAWVPQQPFTAVDPRFTLARAIELPARLAGVEVDAAEAAEWCGLAPELLGRRPNQVSGGELQRACIVRALALQPDYLVLDEITAMLDARTADDVMEHIRRHVDERGIGVLMISHDLPALEEYADIRWRMDATADGPRLRPADDTTTASICGLTS
ncbi:ABC transporter ATP-binding protein [Brooklawnia cerclae]|uniref:Peptide/nickel transport system ATP-binding protein n=1 Tax=Brooklawnia cerclae TaxID=349934 RepID=A0ABX0SB92_9ACTN|nr:ATP-binding cassette domain-containing protein [Brooklawnia cerclae]NIH55662.1 peptide/nickel transport system ATP-binding protein [Brooklawnia cerclae]